LFLCLAAFLSIWLGVKWERNRVPLIMLMVLVLSLSAAYAGEKNRTIQKRDRFHVMIPVSLWQLGMAHLLYPLFVLAAIYLLLLLSVIVSRPLVSYSLTVPSLSHMLTLTGFILIVNAVILLHRDLRMTFTKKPQRLLIFIFWFVLYVGALFPFYVVTNFFGLFGEDTPAQNFITRLLESPAGFIALGMALSVISLVVFIKRKSYVDS
jgi:hypothetical protein